MTTATAFSTENLTKEQLQRLYDLIDAKPFWDFIGVAAGHAVEKFIEEFFADKDDAEFENIYEQVEGLISFSGPLIDGLNDVDAAKPRSFVVDLIRLAGEGKTGKMNIEALNKAKKVICKRENNDSIINFEDVTKLLNENRCGSEAIFGCTVTDETEKALAAYLYYSEWWIII